MKQGRDYIGISAGAMIFNEKGELFLAKRGKHAKNERGHWETPGGSVEFGETLEDAARREIYEEYGVEIDIIEQFSAADHLIPAEKQHWVATTFLARVKSGQIPTIKEPDKCDAIGWFALGELPKPLSLITKLDLKEYEAHYRAEMVDVVDEQDEILYKTSKAKTHKLGLLHRTVIGTVKNSSGKILLVKQARDRQDAGQYVHPIGGHVRSGETEDEAIKREALEEMGYKDFSYTLIGKAIFNRTVLGRKENHLFIVYEITSDETPELNHEAVSVQSFTPRKLQQTIRKTPTLFGKAFYFVAKQFHPEVLE